MADISFIKLLALHAKTIINLLRVKLSYVVVVWGSIALSRNCSGELSRGNCLVNQEICFSIGTFCTFPQFNF